ncbi:MAG: family hydrolase [Bacteroidota bacterium]|nr:family hydrolase [Bacteroidota bacterium]
MQDIQHFIFDLDGTITHPQPGIIGGYHYMFKKLGVEDKPDEELIPVIGPPLKYVLSHIFNFSPENVDLGFKYYREYYYEKGGMYEATIFDGMKDLFECLKQRKKMLHVATNKSYQVDKILEHFNVLQYFSSIEFYNEEKNVISKERMIENIIESENVTDKHSVVMIGDRKHDLLAAKNVGITAVGVLYGFGSKEELENCNPDHIVKNVAELRALLCP